MPDYVCSLRQFSFEGPDKTDVHDANEDHKELSKSILSECEYWLEKLTSRLKPFSESLTDVKLVSQLKD
jgi:hypothetical protein